MLNPINTDIQLLRSVTGSVAFGTPEGEHSNQGEAEGAIFPKRVYKTHGPQLHSATIVFLYLGNIIIPLLKVLLSSSNITTEYA